MPGNSASRQGQQRSANCGRRPLARLPQSGNKKPGVESSAPGFSVSSGSSYFSGATSCSAPIARAAFRPVWFWTLRG